MSDGAAVAFDEAQPISELLLPAYPGLSPDDVCDRHGSMA